MTGDAEFDALFEILAEVGAGPGWIPSAALRGALVRLRSDPWFDKLLLFCSPHEPQQLLVVHPPMPELASDATDVFLDLAQELALEG